ncbi:MAG: hypothetical protein AB7G06_04815 [Bdellovibrionales bacterium]
MATQHDLARHDDEAPNAHLFEEAAARRTVPAAGRPYCEDTAIERLLGEGGPCIERDDTALATSVRISAAHLRF